MDINSSVLSYKPKSWVSGEQESKVPDKLTCETGVPLWGWRKWVQGTEKLQGFFPPLWRIPSHFLKLPTDTLLNSFVFWKTNVHFHQTKRSQIERRAKSLWSDIPLDQKVLDHICQNPHVQGVAPVGTFVSKNTSLTTFTSLLLLFPSFKISTLMCCLPNSSQRCSFAVST